ncbi:hypothetical protein B0H10DRAFT_1653070, partial [Mycena sp. CBHHK59/15]
KEAEKKKPKLAAFNADLHVPDYLVPRPSNFAKHKLETFEYCELCSLALQPLSAFRASKHVVHDENLTWGQFSIAKTRLLSAMEAAGWSATHRTTMAIFFYGLETHPFRLRKYGEKVLIIYQARVRRDWHD